MHEFVRSMPRQAKQGILLMLDVLIVPVALLAAFALYQNVLRPGGIPIFNIRAVPLLMGISALLAVVTNTYRIQLKAYEVRAIGLTAIHAVCLGFAAFLLDNLANYNTPLSVFINFTLLFFLASVATRIAMLQVLLGIYRRGTIQCRVIIYGAGLTGRQLAAALGTDETILPVAFVDDNRSLQGGIVQGLTVHSPIAITRLAQTRRVDRVLLAMPSMPRAKQAQLSRKLEDLGLDVQALPSFAELAQGGLVDQLEPVAPGRFLGRAALDGQLPAGADTYEGRTVMISGAGGSIGSELCRQILSSNPSRLVLLEISELALYTIDMELRSLTEKTRTRITPILGSVTDGALMRRVLRDNHVDVILHAAAYKHVPIVEANPAAGMANNVLGTRTLAKAAADIGIERFILISSDKAVRPTNVMGASKRLAEIVVQDLAAQNLHKNAGKPHTIFSMVRFGNVIGSSGSVIPLFQDQIQKGGPVTLTHDDVTRYFMTIPEAARLVLLAGSFGQGGDVFVLDMGEPVRISDLARQMIHAAGYTVRDADNPDGDIAIETTGLRPGEKIYEELLIGEGQLTTPHPKIMQAREEGLSQQDVQAAVTALKQAIVDLDTDALRAVIARFVEGGGTAVDIDKDYPEYRLAK